MLPSCQHLDNIRPTTMAECKQSMWTNTEANAFNYYVPSSACNLKKCNTGVIVVTHITNSRHIYGDPFENFVYIDV